MPTDGQEEIIQVPGGEVLVKISRTDIHAVNGKKSWIGTIFCRSCITEAFKEVIYIVDEDIRKVEDQITTLLKNLFYKNPDN